MGNHATHPAFGIGHVALVSGNKMHVTMKDRLASGFAYVNTDIISIGMETLVNLLSDILQHDVHGLALMVRQIKVGGDVPLGDDKRMTGRDGIAVVEGYAGSCLADDFHSAGKAAERTRCANSPNVFWWLIV